MTNLSKDIKAGTKKSHSAAENTKFVSQFLKGVVSEENYRKLLKDFYFVYAALEEEFTRLREDPLLQLINFPEVWRVEMIKKDLEYYYGPQWAEKIAPSEGAIQYVERIHDVATHDSYLLVGHHYTRYLGDLSGGQILKGITEKALDLPIGRGTCFYEFPDIYSPEMKKQFKITYRKALDSLPLDEEQIKAIIVEANYAFRLNMYLFDQIEGESKDGWKSGLKVFWKTLRRK